MPPHGSTRRGVEELLGRFVDASWAYRFGPPAQDVIVTTLESEMASDAEPASQSVRFPAGRPTTIEPADRLGLETIVAPAPDGTLRLRVATLRFAYGVRVRVPGFEPHDDAFCIEPGRERLIRLEPLDPDSVFSGGELVALNLRGRVRLTSAVSNGEGDEPTRT